MVNKVRKAFIILGIGCLFYAVPAIVNACNFHDVLSNCEQTALNNYNTGNYGLELYDKFKDVYCPAAALGCLENAKHKQISK